MEAKEGIFLVWQEVTAADAYKYSLTLADRVPVNSFESIAAVAAKLLEAIKR